MLLEVKEISKKYGKLTALDRFSCSLHTGELVGLVGPNGAGKSTLIKLLATLSKPTSGDILLDGKSIVHQPAAMQCTIGYLPQDVAVYPNLNAMEFLGYMASVKGLPKAQANKQIPRLMEMLHLSNTGKRHLSGFSGGMCQRVGIACTLLGDPQIIIVDEPTTGLDPQERIIFRNILAELAAERLVILSTHIVSDIEAIASRVLILKDGRLMFNGEPKMLVRNAEGHVWEYTVPNNTMKDTFGVSSMIQTESGVKVRHVCKNKPAANAISVTASLEDACLHVLEGVSA